MWATQCHLAGAAVGALACWGVRPRKDPLAVAQVVKRGCRAAAVLCCAVPSHCCV